jgi:hypothetical protein
MTPVQALAHFHCTSVHGFFHIASSWSMITMTSKRCQGSSEPQQVIQSLSVHAANRVKLSIVILWFQTSCDLVGFTNVQSTQNKRTFV